MTSMQGSGADYNFTTFHYQPIFNTESKRVEIKQERRTSGAALSEANFLAQALTELDQCVQSIAKTPLIAADKAVLHHFSESLIKRVSQSSGLSDDVKNNANTLLRKIAGLEKKLLLNLTDLPIQLIGKISSFLPLSGTKGIADMHPSLKARKTIETGSGGGGGAAAAAAATAAAPNPAGDYWFEALGGKEDHVASKLVRKLIISKTLPFTFPEPEVFEHIKSRVRHLDLNSLQIDEATLQELHRHFPDLTSLNLQGCAINDQLLQTIATQWKNLQTLNLTENLEFRDEDQALDRARPEGITDTGLELLATLPQLRNLNLTSCNQITDTGLGYLRNHPQLRNLNLTRCHQITDTGFTHLATLTQLQDLRLGWCERFTDAGLGLLATLTQLRNLHLRMCDQITGEGFAHLRNLPQLQGLDLYGCDQITSEGFTHLAALSQLRHLILDCSQITDTELAYLAALTNLQELNLRHCPRITDEGLANLRTLMHPQNPQIKR